MTATKTIAFVSGGVILVIIAVIAVIFFFPKGSSPHEIISEEQLSNAPDFLIKEQGNAKFILNNKTYQINIDVIYNKSINLTILNTTIITKITIGQIRDFDLEEDGIKDITIKLNNISDKKANLSIKKFYECIENWTCTEWSACNGQNQTRKCTDLTNCSTELNKPDEFKECQFNCSQQKGVLCTNTQTCNGTTTDSSDEKECCIGKCIGTATGAETGTCGKDINCLITAAETCTIANLTYSSTSTNGTWTQTAEYYYEIRGLKDDKCRLYREVLSVAGSYSEAGRQSLINGGKTAEEVNQMENSIEDEQDGETGICRFSTYG
jgi:hypothetical protein